MRAACGGLIYQKMLKLPKSSTEEGQNGKIINLMSSDLARFDLALSFLYGIWEGPLQTTLFSIVIYMEIGVSGIIGVMFLFMFVPLQGKCTFSSLRGEWFVSFFDFQQSGLVAVRVYCVWNVQNALTFE